MLPDLLRVAVFDALLVKLRVQVALGYTVPIEDSVLDFVSTCKELRVCGVLFVCVGLKKTATITITLGIWLVDRVSDDACIFVVLEVVDDVSGCDLL